MSDDQNQSQVLAALLSLSQQVAAIDKNLAINTTETAGMREQLTKLNGKVATHEANIAILTQTQALFTQAKTDKEKITSNWQAKLLDKIVWLGLGLFAVVIYTLLIKTHTITPLSTLDHPQTEIPTNK